MFYRGRVVTASINKKTKKTNSRNAAAAATTTPTGTVHMVKKTNSNSCRSSSSE
jgi:hypothetical protein